MNIHNLAKHFLNFQFVIVLILIHSLVSHTNAYTEQPISETSYSFTKITEDIKDFPVKVPTSYESRRGYLIVEEPGVNGSNMTNKLPVVIIKAKSKTSKPPVLKLAGGPGISGLIDAAYPGAYPWLSDRDYILLGQRGTQDSEPALVCPEYLNALTADNESNNGLVQAASKCRNRYDEAGIDLNVFNSSASAKDIEGLRVVLNINEFAIYAGSYGTRLALTYARDFPTRVSSMVLDSPLPHNAIFDDEYPDNLKEILMKVAIACHAQPKCAATFPNVFARFVSTISQISNEPWSFITSDGIGVTLTDYELVSLLNTGSSYGISRVPLIMDAIAKKDIRIISKLLDRKLKPTKFAWGMRLSVWCSESLPFSQRSVEVNKEAFAHIDGAVISPEVCEIWNVKKRPIAEIQQTTSTVPTLIIAGEFDALTPPKWGHLAAESLENSYVVTVPYGRHSETKNWSGDGCPMSIAKAFFKDESAFLKQPTAFTECLQKRQPPEFVLSID